MNTFTLTWPARVGRDTVVYCTHSDYLAPNTPFAEGQYCTGEYQASMDSDVRQMLSPTRATGFSIVIDSIRAWTAARPPVLPSSLRRDQLWLHSRIEESIDATVADPTLQKGEAREQFRSFREEINYWKELAHQLRLLNYDPAMDLS